MNFNIEISEYDFKRLSKLVDFYHVPMLIKELERADVIKDILVPPDLVTVDSTIVFSLDKKIHQTTLVTSPVPEEQMDCVSVLDHLGTALLGLSENQKIRWKFPDGERLIHVLDVVYQPEAEGDLHPLCFG